jgi:hypothetical protein
MSKEKKRSVVLPSDTQIKADKYATFVPRISADLAVAILSNPPDRTKPAPGRSYYHLETFEEIEARREKVDKLLEKYKDGD